MLSSQTWTAWHPKKLAATASRTAYVLKAGSQSCYEKTGLPGINKIIEGYHSKMNMFAEYVVTLSLFSLATMLKWKAFLLEGFVYRCRSFPSQAWKDEGQCLKSKDGRPYQYIAGFKANHKTTRIHQAFFNKLVFAALFGRQQGSLVFGAVEGWAPQIFPTFARVPVPLSLRLRNCHTGSSNKCEPYDFAVNGEGGVVEVILTFLESVGPFWCAIYLRFVLSSFIPSLWALEYHWNIIAFCYYCWFNWFVVSLCPLSLEPGHAFDTFHVWDSMGVSDAPRDTDSGFPAS